MSDALAQSPILVYWNRAAEWINARSYRERLIGAVVVIALLTFFWFQTVSAPMLTEQRGFVTRSKALESELTAMQLRKAEINQQLQRDPNVRLREKLDRLTGLESSLDAQVKQLSASWLPPAEMANALRQILAGRGNLKLLTLTSDVPEAVVPEGDTGNGMAGVPAVYLHGMEIHFQGTFFDVLGYLEAVEAVPWSFQWSLLSYDVEEYPNATVVLRVQTYSPERAWIGV